MKICHLNLTLSGKCNFGVGGVKQNIFRSFVKNLKTLQVLFWDARFSVSDKIFCFPNRNILEWGGGQEEHHFVISFSYDEELAAVI